MQQQSEQKVNTEAAATREIRKRGRLFGRYDPKTLRLLLRRGNVEMVIDMQRTVRTRELTVVHTPGD